MVVKAREKKRTRYGWIVLFFSEEEIPISVCFLSHVLRKKTRERKKRRYSTQTPNALETTTTTTKSEYFIALIRTQKRGA